MTTPENLEDRAAISQLLGAIEANLEATLRLLDTDIHLAQQRARSARGQVDNILKRVESYRKRNHRST